MKASHLLSFAMLLAAVMSSCDSKKDELVEITIDENDQTSIGEIVGESENTLKVSKECAAICKQLDVVEEEVEFVKSPSNLIRLKKNFAEDLKQAKSGKGNLVQEEQSIVSGIEQDLQEEYTKACREYEVPADGVIANLKNCIKKIDAAHTRQEFDRFRECRTYMLEDLDNIHLCVISTSRRIPEVKQLAQTLKAKYIEKKQQFGIE